jgi:hypothetical protein
MLSADAHNNTSLLRSRHAQPVGDGFEIGLYLGIGGYGSSVLGHTLRNDHVRF